MQSLALTLYSNKQLHKVLTLIRNEHTSLIDPLTFRYNMDYLKCNLKTLVFIVKTKKYSIRLNQK